MVNAMLWVAKTGSQWRMLPGGFPPWGAVWQQFRRWRDSGLWARVLRRLHRLVRVKAGRRPEPSMVLLDASQSKSARLGPSFHDVGGVGRGRVQRGAKRSMLVDIGGVPLAAKVTSSRPHDSTVGNQLLDEVLPELPTVRAVLVDRGYRGLAHHAAAEHGVTVEVRDRDERPEGGFKPLQPVWRVEDAFAQLGRWRRLTRSFEGTAESATAWVQVAACGTLLARLAAP
jgi:putative transposase